MSNRKYDVGFCKCGRIHALDATKVMNALDNDKHLLWICARCGQAMIIGADSEIDLFEPDKICYNMYSYDFSEHETAIIDASMFENVGRGKSISEIIYSHGYPVHMKNGRYANYHGYNVFEDVCMVS